MASTFSSRLRLEKQATGEHSNTWGAVLNSAVIDLLDDAVAGMAAVAVTGGAYSLTTVNSAADEARMAILKFTGVLTSNSTVTIPDKTKIYVVHNATTGAYTLTLKPSGNGVLIPQGLKLIVFCDGTACSLLDEEGPILTAGGTADAITLTPTPPISAYAVGQKFRFLPVANNTTATTIAVSGLAVKTVVKTGTDNLGPRDIRNGVLTSVTYDGTYFQLESEWQRPVDGTFVSVGNITIGEDNLMSYILPANQLTKAGTVIKITATFTTANNANAKTLKMYIGGVLVLNFALTINQASGIMATAYLISAAAANSQTFSASGIETVLNAFTLTSTNGALGFGNSTLALTSANAQTIQFTGEGTNTNDIVQTNLLVEVIYG